MKTSDKSINIKSSDNAATMVSTYTTPNHYSGRNGITCDDAIRAALTPEEYRGIPNAKTMSSINEAVDDLSKHKLKSASSYNELEKLLDEYSSDSAMTMVSTYTAPNHYNGRNGITCDDAIKAALTPEEYRGWCKGNILKYVWREAKKGKDEDLLKCRNYVNFALHDR